MASSLPSLNLDGQQRAAAALKRDEESSHSLGVQQASLATVNGQVTLRKRFPMMLLQTPLKKFGVNMAPRQAGQYAQCTYKVTTPSKALQHVVKQLICCSSRPI